MTDPRNPNEETTHRSYAGPYTSHHPVPTVKGYRERLQRRKTQEEQENPAAADADEEGKLDKAIGATKQVLTGQNPKAAGGESKHPYEAVNRNETRPALNNQESDQSEDENGGNDENRGQEQTQSRGQSAKKGHGKNKSMSSHEAAAITDPKKKRKAMKNYNREGGREVTDPVTHLPITISDYTERELRGLPDNTISDENRHRYATGYNGASKSKDQLNKEQREVQNVHDGMQGLFPPPEFTIAQQRLASIYKTGITRVVIALLTIVAVFMFVFVRPDQGDKKNKSWFSFIFLSAATAVLALTGAGMIWFVNGWMEKKAEGIWEDGIWSAARDRENKEVESETPESTQWLNSLLASIWPLINPDLFTSLADTLEDVMQASLPKAIRMISVDDLGQGSEALRILGVRWLPTGAAAQSVSKDGKLKPVQENKKSDRTAPGQGEVEHDTEKGADAGEDKKQEQGDDQDAKTKEQEEENIAEGLEGEQGDFVNMELAFAYRATSSGKSLRTRAKNAHLYLNFYLPAGIRVPVWVEMRGIVGVMRVRLQLTPDPPFFSLATITFLGQPKADMSCVPLTTHAPNIMDVPFISSFVQSAIDAALAEYVAPKSLTLDLKNMLVGDDFKKDTVARGIIMVQIKRAREFKEGDGGIGPLKKGTSDPYVTVGWAKFGKPVFSTRVIINSMKPVWDETALVLVTPEEVNAEERLRIQLWDSDKSTADDDLGRTEIDLKDLMEKGEMKGKMMDRHDNLVGADAEERMPGWIEYSVGYFSKTHITRDQLKAQKEMEGVSSQKELKERVDQEAERKLREAGPGIREGEGTSELDQQKAQDFKEKEDTLLIAAPPPVEYASGIFSIQIHQVTGLELASINRNASRNNESGTSDAEQDDNDDLPSAYCNVILNHSKIFKTRTKPKNAKPFFNAGTERFIRDWRTTEVMLSVRDSRVHENDPLLGIVYLPLAHVFKHRSQVIDSYPLVGGIGYGRVRISMVFRAVKIDLPRELQGWDYGTIEICAPPKVKRGSLPEDLEGSRITARTSVSHGKMFPSPSSNSDGTVEWSCKHGRSLCLAVRKRYSTYLVLAFRKNRIGADKTPAFAILWLKDIPDDEEKTVTLSVYRNHDDYLKTMTDSCMSPSEVDESLKLGAIEVTLKFWRGLGGFHRKLASRDPNLKDVFEVMDTENDNEDDSCDSLSDHVNSPETSSSSSSDDDEQDENGKKAKTSVQKDGRRNPVQQAKDYKQHHKLLHRQHRGLMQWKAPRSLDWMRTKAEHGKERVLDNFRHNERDAGGVETEV